MANQVIGTIMSIGATQSLVTKAGKSFQKRDLIISVRRFDQNTGEPVSDYENTPIFTFIGERCAELDKFSVGQCVVVSFDINGRQYVTQQGEKTIINDIRPYKIELYGKTSQVSQASQQPYPQQPYPQQPNYPQQQGGFNDPFSR